MNTITITSKTDDNGNALASVTYSESEVLRFIERAKEVDATHDQIRNLRTYVRDFFNESEWSYNEATISKNEVNVLLDSIGCNRITSKYKGTFVITGTFIVDAEDDGDVEDLVRDNITVDSYDADLSVDDIEILDTEEYE